MKIRCNPFENHGVQLETNAMRYLTILFFSFAIFTADAQTKKIAFKSHSGEMDHFFLIADNPKSDLDNYNFGVMPDPVVRTAHLDSVILLCDTAVIMITSEYCRNRIETSQKQTKWKAGKDTVYSHPVFNTRLSLDSIKRIISKDYYFRNPVDKIVFIGFDKPVTLKEGKREDSFDGNILLITGLITGLSLIRGLTVWRLK